MPKGERVSCGFHCFVPDELPATYWLSCDSARLRCDARGRRWASALGPRTDIKSRGVVPLPGPKRGERHLFRPTACRLKQQAAGSFACYLGRSRRGRSGHEAHPRQVLTPASTVAPLGICDEPMARRAFFISKVSLYSPARPCSRYRKRSTSCGLRLPYGWR
jgi:hypothetical protein